MNLGIRGIERRYPFTIVDYWAILVIVNAIRHSEHLNFEFNTLIEDVNFLLPPTIDVISGRKWKNIAMMEMEES